MNTRTAIIFVLLTSLILSSCGPGQMFGPTFTPTPSPTFTPSPTLTSTPTNTPTPTLTPTPTSTPDIAATQRHEAFFPLVQEFYDKGYIRSARGSYYPLDDYSVSEAAVGYFKWNPTGKKAVDFIIKTRINMSTANNPSSQTGCGIAFHTLGDGHSLVTVHQDGRAYFERSDSPNPFQFYRGQVWGNVSNPVELDFLLIVNRKNIRLFVNENQVLEYTDKLESRSSDVSFAVVAGSYEDYGSRCEFSNTELWIIQR